MCESADGIFGERHDGCGVVVVFLDGDGAVEDGAVD